MRGMCIPTALGGWDGPVLVAHSPFNERLTCRFFPMMYNAIAYCNTVDRYFPTGAKYAGGQLPGVPKNPGIFDGVSITTLLHCTCRVVAAYLPVHSRTLMSKAAV